MRVERHEENRRVEPLEDQVQPRWLAFDHSPHRNCCSVRCHQRTSSRAWRPRARSAETADATAQSAGDSGRYSSLRLGHAFRRFA
jgi:hypothetical protein